jgi:hypothetical protein
LDERRVKIEKAGLCWHCGGDRACETCGSGRVKVEEGSRGTKRPRTEDKKGAGRGVEKRVKVEAPSPMPATRSRSSAAASSSRQLTGQPSIEQDDYNSGAYGRQGSFDQSNQVSPTFEYRSQQMEFRAPMAPMFEQEGWQNPQDFEDQGLFVQNMEGGQFGSQLLNPLYQQQEVQDSQGFQNQGLQIQHIDPALLQSPEEQQSVHLPHRPNQSFDGLPSYPPLADNAVSLTFLSFIHYLTSAGRR